MNARIEANLDLDSFYSSVSIGEWQKIAGKELLYHCGFFRASEDLETGLRQTIRNFYPYITPGSRVLDIGCGWGGVARMLIAECNCSVTGISFGSAQAEYCRTLGLNARQQNLERDELQGEYDLIFGIEILSHVQNKLKLLRQLRSLAPRMIISVHCVGDRYLGERATFGGSMLLCSVSELLQYVEQAGWRIKFTQSRRFQALRTFALWKQNLDRVYGEDEPPGQLGYFLRYVNAALRSPVTWSLSFPLIDIVAD